MKSETNCYYTCANPGKVDQPGGGSRQNCSKVQYIIPSRCVSISWSDGDRYSENRIDMLSGTGRKYLRGPRGTGFLYVRKSLIEQLEPPFIDLHAATWLDRDRFEIRGDAKRFENWESYIAGRIGLAVAVDYALNIGLPSIQNRIQYLADLLRDRLANIPATTVRDLGKKRCGIVTFTKENESATAIKKCLAAQKVNVSVSKVSMARLDLGSRGIDELVRASVHYFNTEEEIDRFCTILSKH